LILRAIHCKYQNLSDIPDYQAKQLLQDFTSAFYELTVICEKKTAASTAVLVTLRPPKHGLFRYNDARKNSSYKSNWRNLRAKSYYITNKSWRL
jgi:hypothetical protein